MYIHLIYVNEWYLYGYLTWVYYILHYIIFSRGCTQPSHAYLWHPLNNVVGIMVWSTDMIRMQKSCWHPIYWLDINWHKHISYRLFHLHLFANCLLLTCWSHIHGAKTLCYDICTHFTSKNCAHVFDFVIFVMLWYLSFHIPTSSPTIEKLK